MANNVRIPAKFFREISPEEFHELCMTSKLNAQQCRRVWQLRGLNPDKAPKALEVYVRAEDVQRLWPMPTKH